MEKFKYYIWMGCSQEMSKRYINGFGSPSLGKVGAVPVCHSKERHEPKQQSSLFKSLFTDSKHTWETEMESRM